MGKISTWDITPEDTNWREHEYNTWRAAVSHVIYLPEYKLKKLWRLHYTVEDIAANKHHAVFPLPKPKLGIGKHNPKRGRRLMPKAMDIAALKAMQKTYEHFLRFNSLGEKGFEHARQRIEGIKWQIEKMRLDKASV